MIQYPINAYPENIAVDGEKGFVIRYNFVGDKLSYRTYQIINYNTRMVASHYIQSSDLYYNDDQVVSANVKLSNRYDYVWRVALAQHQDEDKSIPVYDISVLSGTVELSQSNASTSLTIEKNINSIYEWWGDNDLKECSTDGTRVAYGMIIQIGNENRLIKNYRRSTGVITLDSPFSSAIKAETRYRIYSNYIISPQYYFKCRTTPEINLENSQITDNTNNFRGSAEYTQVENVMIKYYTLDLYWANNNRFSHNQSDKAKKIASSGNIYSQRILYEFADFLYHDNLRSDGDDYYKVVCTIVTQDNTVVSQDYIVNVPVSTRSGRIVPYSTFGNIENSFIDIGAMLYWSYSNSFILLIFREDINTGEEICLGVANRINGVDYTASTHGDYIYKFIGFEGSNSEYGDVGAFIPGAYLEQEIHTNDSGYYITELNEYDPTVGVNVKSRQHYDNRPHYHAGDTWHFVGEIDDSTITQNRNTALHAGASKYSITSNADTNYMSGNLSAMLGYVNCTTKEYTDDITLVQAWRKFITQDKPFLLKSQKGDVWVVNVTDNPTTAYQEDYYKVPTTFSFSWAECCNVNSIVINQEVP